MEQKVGVRVSVRDISKSFFTKTKGGTSTQVVDGVSFDVYENEFLVLLGPGHCGKTVLLNMIAGLETHDSGTIEIDGFPIKGTDSRIGMVFQKMGLLPWKTTIQNVELGPKLSGEPKRERRERARYYIKLVGLEGFENSYPHELSGGMKQRVGIARAYTNDPEILVMDEPFGQLDAQTRYSMQNEIIRIWEKEKRTIIFVTNNIEEATYLGERIVLFSACPATVKQTYEVNLLRPRDMIDPEFLEIRKWISDNAELAL